MRKCYCCGIELNQLTRSVEHIIPNACGGRLTSDDLLCRTCNQILGQGCDAALAEQTNYLMNLLMIPRQRGSARQIRGRLESGEEYDIDPDGSPRRTRPSISKKTEGDRTVFHITANDERHFRQVLQGLKRKYPILDIEAANVAAQRSEGYLGETISVDTAIGGPDVFRAITKIALNYCVHIGIELEHLPPRLIQYVKGEVDLNVVWLHYPPQPIYQPAPTEVSHVLRVVGDPTERILYAYVELFNCHNFIIRLDDLAYEGPYLDETYVFDLLEQRALRSTPQISLTGKELQHLFDQRDPRPFEVASRLLNRVARIASDRQRSAEIKRLVRRVVDKVERDAKDGTAITGAKVADYLTDEIARLWLSYKKDLPEAPI